jgi:hypothetical protein
VKKVIKEYNIQTGEETIIERDETKEEKIERENYEIELAKRQAEAETAKAEAEAKAQAKVIAEGKLVALGLTTDDLRALGL